MIPQKVFLVCISSLTITAGVSYAIILHCAITILHEDIEVRIETNSTFECKIIRRASNATIGVVQCIHGINECIDNNEYFTAKYDVNRTSTGAILMIWDPFEDLLVTCYDPFSKGSNQNLKIPNECTQQETTHTAVSDGATNDEVQKNSGKSWIIVGSVLGSCALIGVCIVVAVVVYRKRRQTDKPIDSEDPSSHKPLADQEAELQTWDYPEEQPLNDKRDVEGKEYNTNENTLNSSGERNRNTEDERYLENDDELLEAETANGPYLLSDARANMDPKRNEQRLSVIGINVNQYSMRTKQSLSEMKPILKRMESIQAYPDFKEPLRQLLELYADDLDKHPESIPEKQKSAIWMLEDFEKLMKRLNSLKERSNAEPGAYAEKEEAIKTDAEQEEDIQQGHERSNAEPGANAEMEEAIKNDAEQEEDIQQGHDRSNAELGANAEKEEAIKTDAEQEEDIQQGHERSNAEPGANAEKEEAIIIDAEQEEDIQQGHAMKDIMIFHSEGDEELAKGIQKNIEKAFSKCERPNVYVDVYADMVIDCTIFNTIDLMIADYRGIVVLLTKNFQQDALGKYQVQLLVLDELSKKTEDYRIVPLLCGIDQSDIKEPLCLRTIKPVHYEDTNMGWIVNSVNHWRKNMP